MTETEALAALDVLKPQLLAVFAALGETHIYLMDDDYEPVAVLVPAEWHEEAAASLGLVDAELAALEA